jgi:hypothetical protein
MSCGMGKSVETLTANNEKVFEILTVGPVRK